jgi:hypothetical protein
VVCGAKGSKGSTILFLLPEQEKLLSRRLPSAQKTMLSHFPIFFGHSTPDRQPTLARNGKHDWDFQFLLTSRKLHQTSPTSSIHDLFEVKFRDFTSQVYAIS